jgi:hypothetical protein
MVNAWEWQYNGITIGTDTIGVDSVEGLDMPDIRVDENDRIAQHGTWLYADWLSARVITFTGDVTATSEAGFLSAVNSLRSMFTPQRDVQPLVYKLFASGLQYRIYCKPTRLKLPVDRAFSIMSGDWVGEFRAEDPRLFNDTEATLSASLTSGTGNVSPVNAGTIRTPHRTVFTGPGTDFKVTDVDTGLFMRVNTTLTAAQTITIDTWARTVVKQDGTNLYGFVTTDSQWFDLATGTHQLTGTVASGASGATKMDVFWRSAWN